MKEFRLGFAVAAVALCVGAAFFSGCGGSGGVSSGPPPSGVGGTLRVAIGLPGGGGQGRWIPPEAQSAKVMVHPEGDLSTIQVSGTGSIPGEVVLSNVSAGPKDVRVWAYDGPGATGNSVAQGVAQVRVLGGRDNNVDVMLQAARLIFLSSRDGNYELYRAGPDGRYFTRLTNNAFLEWSPATSPDGLKIAYAANPGASYEIRTMTATGGSITTFADLTGDDLYPTWSPDSKTIAWINNNGGTYSIQKKNLNGTGAASMPFGSTDISELAWSPDGTRLALAYHGAGSSDIAVVQSSLGGSVTNLTNDSVAQSYPTWSPDGSNIYCSSADSNGTLQLARLWGNLWPSGSAGISLLTNEPWDHYVGGLSPDGELVACWAGNWFTGGNWNLFYYPASGAPLGERGYIRVTYTTQSDWYPTFLPPTKGGGSVGYE